MSTSKAPTPATFAVIGLGGMGVEIVRLALEHGHVFLGAADVGAKVGQPVRTFVDHPGVGELTVSGSIQTVIDIAGRPDVVVISASIGVEKVTDLAAPLLEHGINVLTLEAGLFEGIGPHAERLAAAGIKGNASFLATGIQDSWWVHLPAAAAGANHKIRRVMFDDHANIFFFSRSAGEYEAGVKLDDPAFAAWRGRMLSDPPVQGGPLRELALRLGYTPGPVEHDIVPLRCQTPVAWSGADTQIEPGEISGARYIARFSTDEGVEFLGHLTYEIRDPEIGSINRVIIDGEVTLKMEFPDHQALLYVPLGLVRRIPDVVAQRPGVLRVADLDLIAYQHPA